MYDYYILDGLVVRVKKGFKWDRSYSKKLKDLKIESENPDGSWVDYPHHMDFLSWAQIVDGYVPIGEEKEEKITK